ncbi:MAG: amino acid adenylation domain-containing protein [Nitrospira sp.]|nr:MAG: amino acid adenylation domain-containing protein [Nitrospira sp.]
MVRHPPIIMPPADTLLDVLRWRADRQPDQVAYVFLRDGVTGDTVLTYGELDAKARAIAGFLQQRVQPGDRVMLLYSPGLDFVAAFWGCLYAGVLAVPAPPFDPLRIKQTLPRLQSIVRDAQVSGVFTRSLAGIDVNRVQLSGDGDHLIPWFATDEVSLDWAKQWTAVVCQPQDVAYLQYTSGSTSSPKGVMVTHRNLVHHCEYFTKFVHYDSESRTLSWMPHFHDYGLVKGILHPLSAGIPTYLMSALAFLKRPICWLKAIERYGITHSGGPNFAYGYCVRGTTPEERQGLNLSSWQVASCGAEPISMQTVQQFTKAFESSRFRPEAFYPAYGMAEFTLLISLKPKQVAPGYCFLDGSSLEKGMVRDAGEGQKGTRSVVSCGQPVGTTQVVIVDPQTMKPCAPEAVGEIWLADPSVTKGYWNRPDETQHIFGARLAETGTGPYLRTGDLGFMRKGELYVTGRLKDLIIIRGRNYYPHDLEWVAEQAHPGLRRGCGAAFSIESETGERVVLVYEIEKKLPESDLAEVMSCIRRALADGYELEVHQVVLVKSGTIARTSSGKIKRHACRADFESGQLAVVGMSTLGMIEEEQNIGPLGEIPRTPVEKRLADIWQEVLGGSQPRRHENFFALGGNSLLAAQVVARILDVFHVELPLSVVFEYPTFSALATRVSELSTGKNTTETAIEGLGSSGGGLEIPLVPLSPVSRQGRMPLSFSQQRLWFLELVNPSSSINHIYIGVRLRGPLNPETLERSIRKIISRHEILRTRFGSERGEGFAEVSGEAVFTMVHHDLQALNQAEQEIEVRRLLRTQAGQPFDLGRGPLFRVALAALDQDQYVLALTFHHLIADGWALRVFCKELALLYEAGGEVRGAGLSKLSVQYADYANWQRSRLNQGLREVHRAYWIGQLSGVRPLVELPADRPRPRMRTFEGGVRSRSLSPGLAKALDIFCRQQGVTTFMVLYAVFVAWLHRYTQESDVVVGSVVVGRRRVEIEDVIGDFVNTVALRSELSDELTGQDLLKQVRRVVTDAFDHQDLPFEEVVEALSLRREGALSPLFNVMIVCEDDPLSAFKIRGLEATHLPWEVTAVGFDLVLMVVNKVQGLELALLYDATIFDQSTVSRMLGQLESLLGEFIKKPEARLGELSLLTSEERRHILAEWNRTNDPVPFSSGIHALIEAQVERTPEAIAVTCGDKSVSYRELNQRANRVATALQTLGVCADVPVGLCVERSVDGLVGLLGILKAGGGYVPLDPSFPDHRLRLMLDDAKVAMVVTQGHLRRHLDGYGGQICDVETLCQSTMKGGEENLAVPVSPDQLAYIMYTSGSTGRPKGVAVTHRNLVTSLRARLQYYPEPISRFLLTFSLAFDGSVTGIFWTLLRGGELVIPPEAAHRDPAELAALIARHHISHVVWVPSLYHAVLGEALNTQLESLRIVITAGESLPLELVRRHYQFVPSATLYNEYGPTEATVWCSVYHTTRQETGARVPIGKPIDCMQLYVLDAGLEPVPIGVPGELYVAGDCLARGYVNQPQLTQERFLTHPHVAGARLYRTGDRARHREDGNVEFLGRVDQQVKLRGYRIELGEVEYVLSNFPGVYQAAVLLRQDKPEQQRLVGYVTGLPELKVILDQVRSYAVARLPHYMVPSVILWVDVMPLTATGKINRSALPVPEETAGQAAAKIAPRSQVEEALSELWKSVLGVPVAGIHDNFFEHGGHSLLATQLVSRMREAFDVEISLRVLFERPTIVGLAEEVTRVRRGEWKASAFPPIVRVPRDQPLPLSYSQQRMWLMYRLAPEGTAYNIPFASRQMGPLNKAALRSTIDAICSRHEAFRTTFAMTSEGPVQIISPFRPPHWVEVNLFSRLPDEHRRQEAARLVEQEATQPFDLEKGPLVRFLLIEIGPEDHVLMLTMHHIIGDQWSFGVIGSEFAFFYNAFCRGEVPSAKPISLQYADYAVWQRRCLTDEWLSTQSDYWQKQLVGLSKLSLPTDYPRPVMQTFNGSHCMVELPASLIERLKQFSAEHNATVFMTLLACFQILLSRYSGQSDIAVGSPIANRTQSAVESIIGSFVNTLVLRTDLSGNPTFVEMLARVRDTALGAYANQDFPFDKLVETMHSTRDHSSAPLVQVLFNLPNAPIGEINVQGLSWVLFEVDTRAAQFDLSLTVETEIARKAYLTFNTDLFERQTAERMLGQYKVLLHNALANPTAKLSDLSMLTVPERTQILQDWNRTHTDYPQSECFPQLFEGQVERTPDALALSIGQATVRYGELNARANRLARYLRTLDVRPGVVVGICLERSMEMVIALLAVQKAGGTYVPLDPEYPRDRLRFMAEDAAAAIVLTSEGLSDRFDSRSCRMLCLDREQERIAQEANHNLPPTATSQDLAYILYTSGSTGQPKGVEIPHRALVNFLCSMRQKPGCSARDVMVSVTTLSFDIAGLELYVPLLVGARVEIVSRAVAMDGRQLRAVCEAVEPTIMQATPATWRMLIEAGWLGSDRLTILCGGEALPQDLVGALLDRSAALWNMYGPTETTIWSTIEKIQRADQEISIGRPIANTDIYILDQFLQPVPVGVSGELYIGGHGVARGYRGRDEFTKERFVPHPFSTEPGARLYRTGDVARYRSDGRIMHLGRVDHQVKIRGFRVELGEIEAVLSRHPATRQVVVTTREDQQGFKQLAAYLVCKEGARPSLTELRACVRAELPDYMTPSFFVFLESMPLTANNKVNLQALPPPAPVLVDGQPQVGPRDQVEVQLTLLWQQVLEVPKIGIHDNFFDLGGHSLKAAQLFFLLEQVYGRRLPLATLFQAPTIAELALVLSREQWVPPWQSLVAIQPSGTAMPIFMVPGVGGNVLVFAQLAKLLGVDQPFYGLQARGLDGKETPFTSVPEMARHYIGEIHTVRPHGPYTVLGICTGGLIAYEMAQQLREQGETATLVMMDTWHPSSYRPHRYQWSMKFWLALFIAWRTIGNIHVLLRMSVKDWLPFIQRKSERLLSFLRSKTGEDDLYVEFQVERVTQSTRQAVARYAMRKYSGRILNIVASKRNIAETVTDTRHAWEELGGKGSQTVQVAARDSGLLLTSPHVGEVSRHLQAFLRGESQNESAGDRLPRDMSA